MLPRQVQTDQSRYSSGGCSSVNGVVVGVAVAIVIVLARDSSVRCTTTKEIPQPIILTANCSDQAQPTLRAADAPQPPKVAVIEAQAPAADTHQPPKVTVIEAHAPAVLQTQESPRPPRTEERKLTGNEARKEFPKRCLGFTHRGTYTQEGAVV